MGAIAGIIVKLFLGIGGPGLVGQVLTHLEKKADSDTERQRIAVLREKGLADDARDVIVAGMAHRMFWVAWSIAAIPMAAWFGWGMADTIANGALPDVASIPPGLQPWAITVWSNIFYTGAAAAGVTGAASAIASAIASKGRK